MLHKSAVESCRRMHTSGYSWMMMDEEDNSDSCLGKPCEHRLGDGDSYQRDRSSGLASYSSSPSPSYSSSSPSSSSSSSTNTTDLLNADALNEDALRSARLRLLREPNGGLFLVGQNGNLQR